MSVYLTDVHIFDGKGGALSGPMSVWVEDNSILTKPDSDCTNKKGDQKWLQLH